MVEYKLFGEKILLRLDPDDEVIESLKKVCEIESVTLGSIEAIGAVKKLALGVFYPESKKYKVTEFTGDYEIAPAIGNVCIKDGEIYIHLHANVGDEEHNAYAGHLDYAVVSATFEAVITKIEGEINRVFSDEIGLNIFAFKDE